MGDKPIGAVTHILNWLSDHLDNVSFGNLTATEIRGSVPEVP